MTGRCGTRRIGGIVGGVAAAAMLVGTAAAQPQYAVANIDADLDSPGLSNVTALNENGDAVGSAFVGTTFLPFVYTYEHGGRFLPLIGANPEAIPVAVSDRDANGEILIAATAGELGLDVVWSNASMAYYRVSTTTGQVLDTVEIPELPGFAQAFAADINNGGKIVGYSQAAPFGSPLEPTVYDTTTGSASLFDFPATPASINNNDQVAGGTFIGELNGDSVNVGLPDGTIGAEITALNDLGAACASILQSYSDGNGRRVRGAAIYDGTWDVVWSNSAFDNAAGINDNGDIVGALGAGAAIREAVYFRAEDQVYFVNDLFAPDHPFSIDGVADINTNRQIGTATPAAVLTPLGSMIIPGDVNGDARVTAADLCAWLNDPVDLDGDGDADADDEQWLIDRLDMLGITVDDCNANGVPDACDLLGTSNDCNENGIPDECEPDCDLDGLPDECESDCNGNSVPDECDVADGTSNDCNGNGVPGECDTSETVVGTVTYDPPRQLIEDSVFTDSVFVRDVGTVADVDFAVDLDFRIGQVTVKLHHAGATAVLIDMPGQSASDPFGFSNLGYDIVLDDEGTGPNIQSVGALFGQFDPITSPPSYIPNEPLSVFDGRPRDGLWTLEVVTGFAQTFDPKITSWSVAVTDEAVSVGSCGDLDGDGDVDLTDLSILLGIYGTCVGDAGYDAVVDIDGSGCVDLADLSVLLANYGS